MRDLFDLNVRILVLFMIGVAAFSADLPDTSITATDPNAAGKAAIVIAARMVVVAGFSWIILTHAQGFLHALSRRRDANRLAREAHKESVRADHANPRDDDEPIFATHNISPRKIYRRKSKTAIWFAQIRERFRPREAVSRWNRDHDVDLLLEQIDEAYRSVGVRDPSHARHRTGLNVDSPDVHPTRLQLRAYRRNVRVCVAEFKSVLQRIHRLSILASGKQLPQTTKILRMLDRRLTQASLVQCLIDARWSEYRAAVAMVLEEAEMIYAKGERSAQSSANEKAKQYQRARGHDYEANFGGESRFGQAGTGSEDAHEDAHDDARYRAYARPTVNTELASSYRTLGASPKDDLVRIKRKYFTLVKRFHPDANRHRSEQDRVIADRRTKALNAAWEVIEKQHVAR